MKIPFSILIFEKIRRNIKIKPRKMKSTILIWLNRVRKNFDSFSLLRLLMKKSSNGQKRFSYRGAKAWNDLPADTKQASSLNSFKNLFRTFSCSFILDFVNFVLCFYIKVFFSVIVYCIL